MRTERLHRLWRLTDDEFTKTRKQQKQTRFFLSLGFHARRRRLQILSITGSFKTSPPIGSEDEKLSHGLIGKFWAKEGMYDHDLT